MHTCTHTCIYACMHTCIHAYMHTCIYAYISVSCSVGSCFVFFFSAGDGRASGRDGQGTCSHGAFGLPHGYGVWNVVVLPDYLVSLAIFLNLARLPSVPAGGVCHPIRRSRPYADDGKWTHHSVSPPCMVAPIRKRNSPLPLPRFSL